MSEHGTMPVGTKYAWASLAVGTVGILFGLFAPALDYVWAGLLAIAGLVLAGLAGTQTRHRWLLFLVNGAALLLAILMWRQVQHAVSLLNR